jgi:hypothetical protein
METDLIIDRGRGPELSGTRITVYNLLPYFLDPTITEEYICRVCEITPQQVAAVRAFALNHADAVMAEHRRIEARMSEGNPPEVIAKAQQTHAKFEEFRHALAQREHRNDDGREASISAGHSGNGTFPTFREWTEAASSKKEL